MFLIEDASNNTWKARLDTIAAFVGSLSGAGDASTNTITSVDGEIVLFSGTTGKVLKRGNSFTGIPKLAAGVPSIATPNQDYDLASRGTISGGTTGSPTAWPSVSGVYKRTAVESALLTATAYGLLPPANSFAPGTPITFIDDKTTGAFGRVFRRSGSDTINGATADVAPFVGGAAHGLSKRATFVTDGTSAWTLLDQDISVNYVYSQTNPTARMFFDMTVVPTGDLPFAVPASPFTGLIPSDSTSPADTVVTGAAIDGLHYNLIQVVPSTALHAAGETLQVLSDGSYNFLPNSSAASPYQILDGTTNPVVWNCLSGTRLQNAIVVLPGNRSVQINGAASGYDFNLIVQQDGTGSRTITALPTGSRVGSAGAGIPTLTSTANAVDWLKGTYTGQTGLQWEWGVFQLNMTAAAPPSCATLGVTGATSGTNALAMNAANRANLGNDFIADATSVCKVEANFQAVGAPNFDVKIYICPDSPRVTFSAATTTNGSNSVAVNSSGLNTGDVGQAVTGPGIPASTYVGTVDLTNQLLTLSSSRTSNVSVNAGAGAGTGTVTVYGAPGTPVNASGSDPVNTTSMPTALTGTGSADTTPAVFTNVGATGLTIGSRYFVVPGTTATFGASGWDSANYINWLQAAGATVGYHTVRASTISGSWSILNNSKQQRFKTYH